MNNYWLEEYKNKSMFNEIDEIFLDIWTEDGNFGDFLNRLTEEQTNFFLNMKIKVIDSEIDDFDYNLTLTKP